MALKKTNMDPFSNGDEATRFDEKCCDRCIKSSKAVISKDGTILKYTNSDKNNMPNRCSIQRDILIRMYSDKPINMRSWLVCRDFVLNGKPCPFMKTERKKRKAKIKGQTELEL